MTTRPLAKRALPFLVDLLFCLFALSAAGQVRIGNLPTTNSTAPGEYLLGSFNTNGQARLIALSNLFGGIQTLSSVAGTVGTLTVTNLYAEGNVRRFGAVGDGVTDDTAALQAALDAHSQVYLPAGTYLVTDTLTVWDNQRISGDGDASVIIGDDTISDLFECASVTNVQFTAFRIAGGATVGISLYAVRDVRIERMTIDYCDRFKDGLDASAVFCRNSTNLWITDCSMTGNGHATNGGTILFGDWTNATRNVHITGNTIRNAGPYGINLSDVCDAQVSENWIDQGNVGTAAFINGYGILSYDQDWPTGPNLNSRIQIDHNIITNCWGTGIYVVWGSEHTIDHNQVLSPAQTMDSGILANGGIVLNQTINSTIDNNFVQNAGNGQSNLVVGCAELLGTNNTWSFNTIIDSEDHGFWIGGNNGASLEVLRCQFRGNTVIDAGGSGFFLDSYKVKKHLTFAGNHIYSPGVSAMMLDNLIASHVSGNLMVDWANANSCLLLAAGNSTRNHITGNTVSTASANTGTAFSIRATGNTIAGNLVDALGGNITSGYYDNIGANVWSANTYLGTVAVPYNFTKYSPLVGGNFITRAFAPTNTPTFIGEEFFDSTAKIFYRAVGTASTNDWKPLQ